MAHRPLLAVAAGMAALGVALATSLGACATPAQPGGSPTTAAPTSAPPTPDPCAAGSHTTITLTESDAGTAVCLAMGGRLEVYLHSTPDARWAPIHLDGAALHPVASGKGTLALGVTGGFFAAGATGAVSLTSSRPACPPASASNPMCGPQRDFHVDVAVP